jgi:Flp pilus assembly protein TadB
MIPESQETKPEAYSSLLAVAVGGAVVFLVFYWFGMTALAAFAGLLVYLILAVPIVLWLRSRRLKRQGGVRREDERLT